VAAAERTGDNAARAHARRGLGHACAVQGHYQDAHDQLAQALGLYCGLDDHLGQARAHHDTAWCYGKQGCHQQALHHSQQSLRLARAAGHRAASSGPAASTHTAPWPISPSAMCPWMPQHPALQRYKVTRWDGEETAA
jgi:tetratricopeptide (TPR) repeat protein